MNKGFEIIYYLLTSPREGYRRIINNHPVWLFVFVLALISTSLSVSGKIFSPTGVGNSSFGIMITSITIFFMLMLKILFATSVLNYSAECFGGRGDSGSAFLGFGFSFIPFVFSTPFLIFTLLLEQPFKGLISFLILLSLSFWVVYLQITSIKEVYSLTSGRAFIAYFAPFIIVVFLFTLILITTILFGVTLISSLF